MELWYYLFLWKRLFSASAKHFLKSWYLAKVALRLKLSMTSTVRSIKLYDVEGHALLQKYGSRALCSIGRWTAIWRISVLARALPRTSFLV